MLYYAYIMYRVMHYVMFYVMHHVMNYYIMHNTMRFVNHHIMHHVIYRAMKYVIYASFYALCYTSCYAPYNASHILCIKWCITMFKCPRKDPYICISLEISCGSPEQLMHVDR